MRVECVIREVECLIGEGGVCEWYFHFTDVNECAVINGGCGQICNDNSLGYNCSCYPGYQLDSSEVQCSTCIVHIVCCTIQYVIEPCNIPQFSEVHFKI